MVSGKCGSYFVPLTALFGFVVMVVAIVLLSFSAQKLDPGVGARQFELFSVYQQGENALTFADYAAKYALQQGVHDVAANGGYAGNSPCGRYAGLNSFGMGSSCYPGDLPNEVWLGMQPWLQAHFGKYEALTGVALPQYTERVLESRDGKTVVVASAAEPIRIDVIDPHSADPKKKKKTTPEIRYSVKSATKQEAAHDMLNILPHLRDSAAAYKSAATPTADVVMPGLVWSSGNSCESGLKEAFYRFVEGFVDCQQQDPATARCGLYDVMQIPAGYMIMLKQQGAATVLQLQTAAGDVVEELPAESTNTLALIYRYSCSGGLADCSGPTGSCAVDLRIDNSNCGSCGSVIAAPHSCSDGRAYCIAGAQGASCSSSDAVSCQYDCNPYDCNPYDCNCVCNEIDPITEECLDKSCDTCYDTCYETCDGTRQCDFSSCTLPPPSSCPAGSPPPPPPGSYPAKSYDYAAAQTEIMIDQNSCGSVACEGTSLRFVKLDGNTGMLKGATERVDITSSDGMLPAWPLGIEKKTYRFCVESEDRFVVYDKETDAVQLLPVQYKFAVRFSP